MADHVLAGLLRATKTLAALAAVCSVWAIPEPTPVSREESYFGLNGSKVFHIIGEDPAKVQERLNWMRELGVAWDRSDLWWHMVEPEQDRFDFSRAHAAFEILERNGVQYYPILCYGAAWMPGRSGLLTDEEFQDFADYVGRTVAEFRGRAPVWSLWNEPNIPNFWSTGPDPEAYFRIVELSYPKMKEADPEAKMATLVLAPLGAWDRGFAERFFQLGGLKYTDIFDYHYYRQTPPEEEVALELAEIQALMARYGEVKPIWITESGVVSWFDGVLDLDLQASLVVRNHLVSLASGVERMFYFDLQNWFDDDPSTWDSQLGLVTFSGEKKPSFHNYRTLVRHVDGREIFGLRRIAPGVWGVLMRDRGTGDLVLAYWQPGARVLGQISLPVQGEVMVVSPEGSVAPAEADALRLDHHPRYIYGDFDQSLLAQFAVRPSQSAMILAAGDRVPFGLVSTGLDAGVEVEWQVETPSGLSWVADEGAILVSETATPGKKQVTVRGQVTLPGGPQTEVDFEVQVEVLPAFTLAMRPLEVEGELVGGAVLHNLRPEELNGSLQLVRDGEPAGGGTEVQLGKLERREIALPLDGLREISEVVTLSSQFLEFASSDFRVAPVPFSAEGDAPNVDGDLSDWAGLPGLELDESSLELRNAPKAAGTTEFAGTARIWLTAEALYFAGEARDETPLVNGKEAKFGWQGDSFELYLGLGGPTDRPVIDKSREFQIGFAPNSSDSSNALVFWYHEDVVLEQAEVQAWRTETGWAIEARVPWEALRTTSPNLDEGTAIGLSVSLNDLDDGEWVPAGNVAGRARTWQGSGMNWINPSGWGLGVLRSWNRLR